MKPSLSNKYMHSRYVGLDIYQAKKRILRDFPGFDEKRIDITYVESPYPRFTVLKAAYNGPRDLIELQASSSNLIRHLPSNYQTNDFLRGFLMIFQHLTNTNTITLDNMHSYFRPMESPASFLPTLADWLGLQLDTLGGEEEVRRFLQYAIPLYRYRGTALGLRAHLAIITGMVPAIIEGHIPYSLMIIDEKAESDTSLFDTSDERNSFTIQFPVYRNAFSDTLIRRLSLIVQREKPAHTKAFISFMRNARAVRKTTVIDTDTVLGTDDGISV
jgi:phage tail-like protein